MSRTNISSGTPWEPIVGYSRAVRVGDVHHVADAHRARVPHDRLPGRATGDVGPGHAATLGGRRRAVKTHGREGRPRRPLRPAGAATGSASAPGSGPGSRWDRRPGSAMASVREWESGPAALAARSASGRWAIAPSGPPLPRYMRNAGPLRPLSSLITQNARVLSSRIVTGPRFTRLTSIIARNTPSRTSSP